MLELHSWKIASGKQRRTNLRQLNGMVATCGDLKPMRY